MSKDVNQWIDHAPVRFAGFGPSILSGVLRGKLVRHPVPAERTEGRAMLHDHCPLSPGVYGWLDANSQICYVGKSKALKKRLLSYFAKNPADPKIDRIRRNSQQLVWETVSGEFPALIREQELIHRWRPDFNTQGQPTRRQPAFIAISHSVAPSVFFTREMTCKAKKLYGPIAGTGELRLAIESLNQAFQLRDCPDKTRFEFKEQGMLFDNPGTPKCIRYELGTCTAPCAGFCSRVEYQGQVGKLVEFLEGKSLRVLTSLEQQMSQAAAECRFERAAMLRNHLTQLTWLDRRLNDIRLAQQNLSGVLPLASRTRRQAWLVLKSGTLIGSFSEPKSPEQRIRTAQLLTTALNRPLSLPDNLLETHWQLLTMSWFRRHPTLSKELISLESALDWCHRKESGKFLADQAS
jgi:excinuclease ABC subunit C